ncbi:Cd2+/Zn2+-exporting ATPase [Erysipelotrichaceae bacterium]|nr:Cd2+/Zn2+-exporting ATPase [Erysipelotrichaceae bacterium]
MEKTYIISGISCTNCADKIKRKIAENTGVDDVSVNSITNKITVKFADELETKIAGIVEDAIRLYEPKMEVYEQGQATKKAEHEPFFTRQLLVFSVGAVIFIIALLLPRVIPIPPIARLTIFLISYYVLGKDVILAAFKNMRKGLIFDENFLMALATLGAFLIGDYPEAVAVMLFYQVGEYFQDLAVRQSKKSITELMDIRPDYATRYNAGIETIVSPEEIEVGWEIIVKPGEKVAVDGIVKEGVSFMDTVALTGESIPKEVRTGQEVLSGYINQSGVLVIEVTKKFSESTVAKIIDLVENASNKKAKTENFMTTFARYYTPIVVIIAVFLMLIPPFILGADLYTWIERGLIFLVISCPCALVISIPLSFFGGIGAASKNGILIKGSNYLEALNNLEIVVMDKTGTLTEGIFSVQKIIANAGYQEEEIITLAAIAQTYSNHPIAKSILAFYKGDLPREDGIEYEEISGMGIGTFYKQKKLNVGNAKLMETLNLSIPNITDIGTKVYVAYDGKYYGCIIIADKIKPDAQGLVTDLHKLGIKKTIMLTGDNTEIAMEVGEKIGVDAIHAELLPADKVEKVEYYNEQKSVKGKLAFIGDGVNDAPVLARADIGIAMGGLGSDAAIEAADIVFMTDEPSKLITAIKIARQTKKIVWQNIAFAFIVKIIFLGLGAMGLASMWEAVFADVGVALLAVLNATRILAHAKK